MLKKIKIMLGVDLADTGLDEKIKLLIELATARLTILLGGIEPPEELEHIILEAAVIRFNRIGSEGLSSHTVEGESLSFVDNDFAMFKDEIDAFLLNNEESHIGKVRFL